MVFSVALEVLYFISLTLANNLLTKNDRYHVITINYLDLVIKAQIELNNNH